MTKIEIIALSVGLAIGSATLAFAGQGGAGAGGAGGGAAGGGFAGAERATVQDRSMVQDRAMNRERVQTQNRNQVGKPAATGTLDSVPSTKLDGVPDQTRDRDRTTGQHLDDPIQDRTRDRLSQPQ
jgi:hypothetical protein